MINNKGITYMEILVAVAVFVLASLMVAGFIIQSFRVQNFSLEQSGAISEARRGVETMVKELRETMPADTGAYALVSADDHELIFYADYDRDNAVERVRYSLDGTDFKKGVVEPTGSPISYSGTEEVIVLSRYVRNGSEPIFVYKNESYDQLPTPADVNDVTLINVYLKINVKENNSPGDFELESEVQLRNLKQTY